MVFKTPPQPGQIAAEKRLLGLTRSQIVELPGTIGALLMIGGGIYLMIRDDAFSGTRIIATLIAAAIVFRLLNFGALKREARKTIIDKG